jgi:hypothetical protein
VTWVSPDSSVKTQIDHLLIDARHTSDILNARTYRLTASDIDHHNSDHFLLGATIRARISKVQESRASKCHRLNVALLQIPGKRKEFRERLDEQLRCCGNPDSWTEVCSLVNKVAEEVLGFKKSVRNDWFDDDCKRMVLRVIEARKTGRDSRNKTLYIQNLQKEKKKLFQRKKRQFEQSQIAKIENLRSINDTRKFYQAVNAERRGFQPRVSICRQKNGDLICGEKGILDRWKEHFQELLNAGMEGRRNTQSRALYTGSGGVEVEAPTRQEVESAQGTW